LLLAALATMALGILLILSLPIDNMLRIAGVIGWCFTAGREIVDISTSHKRYSRLRVFADGSVELCAGDGQRQAAAIGRGCVVLPTVAWLDLSLSGGGRYRAMFRGNTRECKQWRRLQVIWRHLGAAGGSC
jgi:hypothetical protein